MRGRRLPFGLRHVLAVIAAAMGAASIVVNIPDAFDGSLPAICRMIIGGIGVIAGFGLWRYPQQGWGFGITWALLQIPVVMWNVDGNPFEQVVHLDLKMTETVREDGVVTGRTGFGINLVGVVLSFLFFYGRKRWRVAERDEYHDDAVARTTSDAVARTTPISVREAATNDVGPVPASGSDPRAKAGTTGSELLVVQDLKKHFPVTRGIVFQKEIASVKAVDGVSFTVSRGETLGVVGESGCGKSTMARCIMRLLDPTSGRIVFDGRDITHASRADMRPIRRELMMIFQDPYASLNPRKRVGFIVAEALEVHKLGTAAEIKRRVQELLEVVGLNPEHYNRFPHEFSGGQRQRIGVARALAVNPKLIVCDEPVSALDVSVQAQILNLLKDLQGEFGLTYIFIAHDLNVVRHISDRVMVMYLGHAVEIAQRDQLYNEPKHPYTGALLSAVPIPNPELGRARKRVVLEGDVPNPIAPPPACWFHPRCPRFHEGHCDVETPPLYDFKNGQQAACHYPLERWPLTEEEMRNPSASARPEQAEPSPVGP